MCSVQCVLCSVPGIISIVQCAVFNMYSSVCSNSTADLHETSVLARYITRHSLVVGQEGREEMEESFKETSLG